MVASYCCCYSVSGGIQRRFDIVSTNSICFSHNPYDGFDDCLIQTLIRGQISISQQLAAIYADMAGREPIQNATMEALGIDWLPVYQARVVPNAQLIEISVTILTHSVRRLSQMNLLTN